MYRVKHAFDSAFGIKKNFDSKDSVTHCAGTIATLIFVLCYVNRCGKEYDPSFGLPVFLLIFLDICGAIWNAKRNYEWNDLSDFDYKIMETFKICFLFIIPLISFNQFIRTDMSLLLLCCIFGVPGLYLFPFARSFFGRNNLYSYSLKFSLFLNIAVSMRTTFFGVWASVACLAGWAVRRRDATTFRMISRVLTAYFTYLTLCLVAIPRCCSDKSDPCQMSAEQCSAFRTYWSHRHNYGDACV